MNQLTVLKEQEILGKEFVVYGTAENPLFLAKNVAEWIEYDGRSGQLLSTVDEDEKLTNTIYASGQNREMWFLTEDGLYEVLMQSRKPIAKEFKKEVKVILKSIRSNGAYMTPDTIEKALTNPDFIIQLATKLKEEQIARKLVETKLEEQAPLVIFAETCLKSSDNVLMRELSKVAFDEGIKIGQNRLFDKLREWKLIMAKPSTEPYQRGVEAGYFVVEEKSVNTPYGCKLTQTTKVTPKGQIYIIEKLKKELVNK